MPHGIFVFFSTHSAEKICRGTLLCLKKFLVLKLLLHRRRGCITGFSIFFHLTVPKNFVGETFCV